jgi:hypothetical protein
VSLFDPPGGMVFSYLVIIKSMTHKSSNIEQHNMEGGKVNRSR